MELHNLIQGSPGWLAYRSSHFNASDAPAMLGISPYKTRSQLMHELHTGLALEVDHHTQSRFDAGHAAEAAARPLAEEIIDDDLFPVVGSLTVDGLPLSASFDGLTMARDIVFEHKLMNVALADSLASGIIPDQYAPQLEQQLLVSGAEKALFMATSADKTAMEYVWYTSIPAIRSQIIAGWKQFAQDMAEYTPQTIEAAPVGRTPETLPALHIEVTGMVTASNLAEFKEVALGAIRSVNRDLKTDQDFADSSKARKWCADIESKAKAAKQHALGQTASIDDLFRALDEISAEARDTRLELERIEKARTVTLKTEIVTGGQAAMAAHISQCNERIGRTLMPAITADFSGSIKGMSKLDNMRNAVATELARAKIAANEMAERISFNLGVLDAHPDQAYLFNDLAMIVLKHHEDFQMLVKVRISEHQAKEAARIEAETARIAAQERARADAEIAAANAKAEAELAAKVSAQLQAQDEIAAKLASVAAIAKAQVEQPIQAEQDVQVEQNIALEHPTLKLGQIADRLGFALTADFLKSIGFEPAATDKGAKLFHENDFPRMCAVLVRHIQKVAAGVAACAA